MSEVLRVGTNLSGVERTAIRSSLSERRRRLAEVSASGSSYGVGLAGLITEVDAALERLDGPAFGNCSRCDGAVEKDRLMTDPLATVCLECLTDSERSVLERDLELASRVQAALLPPRELDAGGWKGSYLYQPHGTVSGDFVDILSGDNSSDDIFVLLGDVAGKGVAAALLMSHLHATFRATIDSGLNLVEMVSQANRTLWAATTANSYATLAGMRLSPDGNIEVCNAGHTPPLLISRSGIRRLTHGGVPLGLFCSASYQSRTFRLAPGDSVLLYSDGLSESLDRDEEELGVHGVEEMLRSRWDAGPNHLVSAVVEAASLHRGHSRAHDDLTVMAITRRGPVDLG